MTKETRVSNEVLTIDGCRQKLSEGWELHVVCAKEPNSLRTTIQGSWFLVVVNPESTEWHVMVTSRDLARERRRAQEEGYKLDPADYAYREIKTANGLYKAQHDLGISYVVMPTREGAIAVTRI